VRFGATHSRRLRAQATANMGLDCGTRGAPRPPAAGFHEPSARIDSLHHRVDRTGRGSEFGGGQDLCSSSALLRFSRHVRSPIGTDEEPDAFSVPERLKMGEMSDSLARPPWHSSLGAAPCSVVAVARPGSPSTAYSPDHKDVGDREEDDLPEGAPELVNTGGLSATSYEVILR
jgi:hypothetical protein